MALPCDNARDTGARPRTKGSTTVAAVPPRHHVAREPNAELSRRCRADLLIVSAGGPAETRATPLDRSAEIGTSVRLVSPTPKTR